MKLSLKRWNEQHKERSNREKEMMCNGVTLNDAKVFFRFKNFTWVLERGGTLAILTLNEGVARLEKAIRQIAEPIFSAALQFASLSFIFLWNLCLQTITPRHLMEYRYLGNSGLKVNFPWPNKLDFRQKVEISPHFLLIDAKSHGVLVFFQVSAIGLGSWVTFGRIINALKQ
jgi:hypothetical protein